MQQTRWRPQKLQKKVEIMSCTRDWRSCETNVGQLDSVRMTIHGEVKFIM